MFRRAPLISWLAACLATHLAPSVSMAATPWWPGTPCRAARKQSDSESTVRPNAPRANKYVIVDPSAYQPIDANHLAARKARPTKGALPAAGAGHEVKKVAYLSANCRIGPRNVCEPIFEPIARMLRPRQDAHAESWTQHTLVATPYPWGWFGARTHPARTGKTSIRGLYRDTITSPGN